MPGGARDSHEDPITAALREAAEETSLDLDLIAVDTHNAALVANESREIK